MPGMRVRERMQQLAGRAVLGGLSAWERLESGVAFTFGGQGFLEDPHSVYRELRERDPVHRSRLVRGWVFTRYDDCVSLFRDSRLSADFRNQAMFPRMKKAQLKAGRTEEELDRPTMLNSDPPRHTRLRGLVSKAFTPRAVSALEDRMVEIVEEMLDATSGRSEFCVIDALAYPLPVIIIAEMLGVPAEDRDRFRHWSEEIVRNMGISGLEDARASARAGRELRAYFESIAEERRQDPQDDLLSALLQAEEEGDRLSWDEVVGTLILLLIAGNETTTNLIGNGMLALLRNPDQLEALRADPELTDNAVEELLRYDSPVQATSRISLEDVEIRGTKIPALTELIALIGSANRDPDQFSDPDVLDLRRTENRPVSFGFGIHFCLGSNLARYEGRTAIRALVDHFPGMKLATDHVEWRRNPILRAARQLPVRW